MLVAVSVHPLEATASVIGTIVVAIVLLTLFFRLLRLIDRQGDGVRKIATTKALSNQSNAIVHLANGKFIQNVKLLGVTDSSAGKGMPWELGGMLIHEREDGGRTLVQSKLVRMIELPPAA